MRSGLRWLSASALAVTVCFAGARTALAQTDTKEAMAKDSAMAKDAMANDTGMAKDAMAKDGMAKNAMGKDEMGKDAMAKDGMVMAPRGTFTGLEDHKAGGTFEIATASGKRELRLGKDFSVDKGPDIYVVLSKGETGGPTGLALGKLKKLRGEQTLNIPAGTDLANYTHVVLWCKKYDANMGAAPLPAADAMTNK